MVGNICCPNIWAILSPNRKDKCWRNLNLVVKVVSYEVMMSFGLAVRPYFVEGKWKECLAERINSTSQADQWNCCYTVLLQWWALISTPRMDAASVRPKNQLWINSFPTLCMPLLPSKHLESSSYLPASSYSPLNILPLNASWVVHCDCVEHACQFSSVGRASGLRSTSW